MPHPNLPLEFILAGSIWLTAILLFFIMLIATFASLHSTDKTGGKLRLGTERKLKFSSIRARFQTKSKTKNRP